MLANRLYFIIKKVSVLITLLFTMSLANAQAIPQDFTLEQLKNYINIKETCSQFSCNSLNEMKVLNVNNEEGYLDISLKASARELSLLELPFDANQVNIDDLKIDNKLWYGASNNGEKVSIVIPPGNHNIDFKLKLKSNITILNLFYMPNNFQNIDLKNKINLIKRNNEIFLEFDGLLKNNNQEITTNLPNNNFFIVSRNLTLGNKWRMTTTIYPLSGVDITSPILLKVPLLTGENVLNEDVNVINGSINILVGNNAIKWESLVTPSNSLSVSGNNSNNYIEKWSLSVEKDWLYTFKGVNPINQNGNSYEWLLWPEDEVIFNFDKPAILKGESLNIENLTVSTDYSTQPFVYRVSFTINSSLGGRTYVDIPSNYNVQGLIINQKKVNIGTQENKISLDLNSGVNNIEITLNKPAQWNFKTQLPELKFDKKVVNNNYNIGVPNTNRWILWTGGANLNPAILFWGILLSLVVFSLFLKFLPTPIGFVSWVLLLFGVSQLGIEMAVLVALSIIIISMKSIFYNKINTNRNLYNNTQIMISICALFILIVILATLNKGLLYNPEIFSGDRLNWFTEQSDQMSSSPWFLSVPIWVYHLLMFIWAIWLSINLIKWGKWFWNLFIKDVLWKEKPLIQKDNKPNS